MGKIVNQRELSDILGVVPKTLWEWQKEGLPVVRTGEAGAAHSYDTAAVIEWYAARAVAKCDRVSAKDELYRLQAKKIQRELDTEDGVLIPAGEIEAAWSAIVIGVRQAFLSMPTRLAPTLEITPGVDAKRALIDEEVRDILLRLAGGDVPEPENYSAAAHVAASPTTSEEVSE